MILRKVTGMGDLTEITKRAKKNCKYCHGRGIEGKDVTPGREEGLYVVCSCVLKAQKKGD